MFWKKIKGTPSTPHPGSKKKEKTVGVQALLKRGEQRFPRGIGERRPRAGRKSPPKKIILSEEEELPPVDVGGLKDQEEDGENSFFIEEEGRGPATTTPTKGGGPTVIDVEGEPHGCALR